MESISPRIHANDDGGKPSGINVTWTGIAIVLAWITSAAVTYAAITARVSVLEHAQGRMERDLAVIMSDVKSLIGRSGGVR